MKHEVLDTRIIDDILSLLAKRWGKSKHPEHFNARTVDEAISLLNEYQDEASIMAGGTDLL